MRTTLTISAGIGLLIGAAGVTPAQALDPGPVQATLTDCTVGLNATAVPNCSYATVDLGTLGKFIVVVGKWRDGTYDAAAGTLTFPAAGQLWPSAPLAAGAKAQVRPVGDITGTVDSATGKIALKFPYEIDLSGGPLSDKCTVKGQAALTSDGTEGIQKASSGAPLDAGGTFALVTTAATNQVSFADEAKCGTVFGLAKDLKNVGVGWYLHGTLGAASAAGPDTATAQKQTASVKLPKKVKAKGKTTLIKRPVFTNNGQVADTKVTWGTSKSANGTSKKYASVTETKQGGLVIKTTGDAKKLFVKLTLSADSIEGYNAYKQTKTWKTK